MARKGLINFILASAVLLSTFGLANFAAAQSGVASVYSTSEGSNRTASGERLSDRAYTAAHKTLPFGTRVRVINRRNGRSVVVRINDRGPFIKGRVIDLTPAGAKAIGMSGLAPVTLSVLDRS